MNFGSAWHTQPRRVAWTQRPNLRCALRAALAMVMIGLFPEMCIGTEESFYLESAATGRQHGPFVFREGEKVKIGKSEFTLVRAPSASTQDESGGARPAPGFEQAAVDAGLPWLALVDAGDFDSAWERAAAYLKLALAREDFVESLSVTRETLGRVLSRELMSVRHVQTMPSAPDGDYVILEFRTEMEHKKSGHETVIPMREEDGEWRISGYWLR